MESFLDLLKILMHELVALISLDTLVDQSTQVSPGQLEPIEAGWEGGGEVLAGWGLGYQAEDDLESLELASYSYRTRL